MKADFLPKRLIAFTATCLLATAIVGSAQCGGGSSQPQESDLFVDPAAYDFGQNPALLERVLESPHGYFRFINVPFGRVVCTRNASLLRGAPRVNLHGDAHVEQYAVTDVGRGLTDFDDSATGPGLLDLVRFGVSLHLTCRQRGWEDEAPGILDRFLEGYRAALSDTAGTAPEPSIVARIRARFESDRPKYFSWVESIMRPLSDETAAALGLAVQPYVRQMLEENPDLESAFFTVRSMGSLHLGIGSALDSKFLLRFDGATADPNDDVVIELKEVRDLTGIPCVQARARDPFRILVSQARIAYEPFRYLGHVEFEGTVYWAHSWVENYREVKIGETFQSPKELEEVAFDVGMQLGLGHPKQIASPLDLQLRQAQLSFLADHSDELRRICRRLTDEVVAAWDGFRTAAETSQTAYHAMPERGDHFRTGAIQAGSQRPPADASPAGSISRTVEK